VELNRLRWYVSKTRLSSSKLKVIESLTFEFSSGQYEAIFKVSSCGGRSVEKQLEMLQLKQQKEVAQLILKIKGGRFNSNYHSELGRSNNQASDLSRILPRR
jgi:hypothetical protein